MIRKDLERWSGSGLYGLDILILSLWLRIAEAGHLAVFHQNLSGGKAVPLKYSDRLGLGENNFFWHFQSRIQSKGCKSGFQDCCLIGFTTLLFGGYTSFNFGFFTKKTLWIHRLLKRLMSRFYRNIFLWKIFSNSLKIWRPWSIFTKLMLYQTSLSIPLFAHQI